MTYAQLLSDLTALNLHPLAETNVDAATVDCGAVFLDFDTSTEEEELAALKDDLKTAVADCTAAEEAEKNLESELREAHALLDEIRDDEGTLLQYVSRAKWAEEAAAKWKAHAEKCERETVALRKRKGLDANYFRLRDPVLGCIFNLATPEAEALKRQLYAK